MSPQLESLLKSARLRALCCGPIWIAMTEHFNDVEARVVESSRLCDSCLGLLDECLRAVDAPADSPVFAQTGGPRRL